MLKYIEILSRRRQFSLLANGDSMLPILRSGDLIYYRKTPYAAIRENDILLVRKKGVILTHRVIYKTPAYLITKGDNNLDSDGKVYPREVMAKAVRLKRNGKIVRLDRLYELQSHLYFRETDRIITALGKRNIDAVILKGLPLHLYYENRRPNRLYADCDILIRRPDRAKAQAVLEKAGYRKLAGDSPYGHQYPDKIMEDSFMKKAGSFPVIFDIHYEAVFTAQHLGRLDPLYPQHLVDRMTQTLLRNKKTVAVGGKVFPILAEDCLVPYLMLHLFHHSFKGIHRFSLIHAILKKMQKQRTFWQKITAFIGDYRIRGFVYPGFLFLMKYCHTPIPPAFLEAIKPSPSQCRYTRERVLPSLPFDEGSMFGSGVGFKQLFFLSPEPAWKKGFVFLTPSILQAMLRLGTQMLKQRLSSYNKTTNETKI